MNKPASVAHFDPPNRPGRSLPFSTAVQAGPWLFISGQAATLADGTIAYGSFEEEMRLSLENLKAALALGGSSLDHIVMTRSYLKSGDDLSTYNAIYREYFAAPYPARTTLTGCLDRLKFEIDAIAVIP